MSLRGSEGPPAKRGSYGPPDDRYYGGGGGAPPAAPRGGGYYDDRGAPAPGGDYGTPRGAGAGGYPPQSDDYGRGSAGGYRDDRYGPPPARGPSQGPPEDRYGGAPPPRRYEEAPPARQEEPAAPAPARKEVGIDRPFDAVIIVSNKNLKLYAEHVERKLIELNLTVDVIFLIQEDALERCIDDMIRRGLLYIVVLQSQHEKYRSVTVFILHGNPQEHRNMPLEDATVMLAKNFNTYVSSLRIGSEQPSMGFLLNLLSDGKHLSIEELERIIKHLQDRRDKLYVSQGLKPPGKAVAADVSRAAAPPVSGQSALSQVASQLGSANLGGGGGGPHGGAQKPAGAELQQKIMSILGNSGGPGGGGGGPGQRQDPHGAAPSAGPAAGNPAAALASLLQGSGQNPDMQRALQQMLANPALLKQMSAGKK